MPPRVWKERKNPAPRKMISAQVGFYPNEVVRILKIEGLDYGQLRRLHELVALGDAKVVGSRWLRFSVEDVVASAAAIELLGGTSAFAQRKRLPWRGLEDACKVLRDHYGISRPLHGMHLSRDGSRILAHHQGITFEPTTGQAVFAAVEAGMREYRDLTPDKGRPKGDGAIRELSRLRNRRPAKRAISRSAVVVAVESQREVGGR